MHQILILGAPRSEQLSRQAGTLGVELRFLSMDGAQEGDWVEELQQSMRQELGVVLCPSKALLGSVALRDAIEAIPLPVVMTWPDHATPEISLLGAVCQGVVAGFGPFGLSVALDTLWEKLTEEGKA